MAPIAKKSKKQSSSSSKNDDSSKTKEELNVQVFLTGNLARLPTEILIDIIGACSPREAMRLLASCKALTLLASSSETFVFRKLYHDLPLLKVEGSFHHIYSPRRSTAVKGNLPIAIEEYLPVDRVLSWKAQYIGACLGNASSIPNITPCCMSCYESNSLLLSEPRWGIKLCQLCFAKNLVTKSNLSTYSLTANDVSLGGLKPIEISLELDGPTSKKGLFYSALQLDCLARQKHGEKYSGPRPSTAIDVTQQYRSDLVAVAYFLHAGLDTYDDLKDSRPSTKDNPVNLKLELDHFISDKAFKKDSAVQKRPIEEILEDLVSIIAYARTKPASESNYADKKLQVSARCDKVVPTDSMIAAYRQYSEVTRRNPLPDEMMFYIHAGSVLLSKGVRAMQKYLMDPTSANLSSYITIQRSFANIRYYLKRAGHRSGISSDYTDVTLSLQAIFTQSPTKLISANARTRLKLISQVSMIIGAPDFGLKEGKEVVDDVHWGSSYFVNKSRIVEITEQVYFSTVMEFRYRLEYFGRDFSEKLDIRGAYSSQFGPWRLIRFCPLYGQGVYQRVNVKLSDRITVSRKLLEDQIEYALKLYQDSIISSSALKASLSVINEQNGSCDGNKSCKSICWIDHLASV